MIIYKLNVRVLNLTMIIDNDLLKQLCESSQLELDSENEANSSSDFLHKLESIVHLFKILDETDLNDSSNNNLPSHFRDDVVNYEELISYLSNTKQFNSNTQMFEVPKVIETE
ncbi:MAG: hypothetical protein P8L77_01620 [Gammaproteobacteria bacterium]|nr:hypothetical protein [Gammaproteobacteria bacterium]